MGFRDRYFFVAGAAALSAAVVCGGLWDQHNRTATPAGVSGTSDQGVQASVGEALDVVAANYAGSYEIESVNKSSIQGMLRTLDPHSTFFDSRDFSELKNEQQSHLIGIGVTNGIHILNRFAEEQNPSILAKSTGKAVLVSALTTIAGFGSLIPAKHQGICSLGVVMSTGVAACMLAALTFLPALLHLLMGQGWTIRKPSGDNARSTLGREEPRPKPQARL